MLGRWVFDYTRHMGAWGAVNSSETRFSYRDSVRKSIMLIASKIRCILGLLDKSVVMCHQDKDRVKERGVGCGWLWKEVTMKWI